MFCANCGNELLEGELFCPKCGVGVDGQAAVNSDQVINQQQPEESATGKQKKSMRFVGPAIVLVLAVVVISVLMFGKSADSDTNFLVYIKNNELYGANVTQNKPNSILYTDRYYERLEWSKKKLKVRSSFLKMENMFSFRSGMREVVHIRYIFKEQIIARRMQKS